MYMQCGSNNSFRPSQLSNLIDENVIQISSGSYHNLALTSGKFIHSSELHLKILDLLMNRLLQLKKNNELYSVIR